MASFFAQAREIIYPGRDSADGPLGTLLLCMTFVSGLVDSFSFLVLGHVFVGNQTGNFILLGLALAGAPGFSPPAQAAALVSFAIGTAVGGWLKVRRSGHRGRYLFAATVGEGAFLIGGTVLAALIEDPLQRGHRLSLIAVLALAMGIQTATARKLAVPDLTTTTFTQLITATFSDSAIVGGKGSHIGRRVVPLGVILAGAFVGTALVVADHIVLPLLIASLVACVVAVTAGLLRRSNDRWTSFTG
jgi:uncharacterized membrane protein YoaK (UPF0700 family)